MGLIKDIKDIQPNNPFNITKEDLIGDLKGFPIGVVVRMIEEQEKVGNNPDIEVFKKLCVSFTEDGGFTWDETDDGDDFWALILTHGLYDEFYKKYPEYRKYDY